jgi:hypothetical protein
MRHKLVAWIMAFLLLCLTASPSFAGNVHFSSVSFTLGSLIASGRLSGMGQADVTVQLDAEGVPTVICTNKAGQQAPGQNPPKVKARGSQFLVKESYTKNGSTPFWVETSDPAPLDATTAGCPSRQWTATITFVAWTSATLSVYATNGGALLLRENYACVTTTDSVSCTLQ